MPTTPTDRDALKLWYASPAKAWVEALPVGNGRLGAMAFGGTAVERLQLNEATLWSGGPSDGNNPRARELLPNVREAVFAGRYHEADDLCRQMQGPYNQSYQPMGDLRLTFDGHDAATNYRRELDLDRAVASVRYARGGAVFTRDVFSSFPDQVIVVRLTCDRPAGLSFALALDSPQRFTVVADATASDTLILSGKCPAHVDPNYLKSENPVRFEEGPDAEGMTFEVRVRAIAEGGRVSAGAAGLRVEGADAVTLILSAATSFNGFDRSPGRAGKDPSVEAARHLESATRRPYDELLRRHVEDHQALFRRVTLDLGGDEVSASLPTDERIRRFHATDDPALAALLFQYGRYLLIASSRPGGQPANLQGIWNHEVRPPWSANWTLNINAQMNYWSAETTNLAECHEPLLAMVSELAVNGRRTAEVNYGLPGWVAHHNADLWRATNPVGAGGGDPVWANWPMGGAWLCQHLWEHYAFGGDERFLRETAWPLMKGAAEFCLGWLVEDGLGNLVTCPSFSPELGFIAPDGRRAATAVASTMDMAIFRDLFDHCVAACVILGVEPEWARSLRDAHRRLVPYRAGSRGQLQEWADDFTEEDVHHRHVSHLFGAHPGNQITPRETPELARAVRRSLELRGDAGTGWSLGWKINLWARLHDGEHAYAMIRHLIVPAGTDGTRYDGGGGLYPNLFDAHPPFQIDGNFAFTAGVAQMLVQSHVAGDEPGRGYEIELLPALPARWAEGRVSGLRARGGFELSLAWSGGALIRAEISSPAGGRARVRYGDRVASLVVERGSRLVVDGRLNAVDPLLAPPPSASGPGQG